MTQQTFTRPSPMGEVGKEYDTNDIIVNTKLAAEDIEFGRKMVYVDDNETTVAKIGTNKVLLEVDNNLGASNVFSCTVKSYNIETKVETQTLVSETYDTSHAVTMGAIVTALKLNAGIDTTTSYNGKIITIIAKENYIFEISDEAVAGGSAVVVTKTNSDTRLNSGFAKHELKEMFEENGVWTSRYRKNDIVNNFVFGSMVVESPSGFNGKDTLYYIGYGADRGKITKTVGDNIIQAGSEIKSYKPCGAGGKGAISITNI